MKISDFPESNAIYGEGQPEYLPLPALKVGDKDGMVISCWKLNFVERLRVLFTGKIFLSLLTFHDSIQPQLMATRLSELVIKEEEGSK